MLNERKICMEKNFSIREKLIIENELKFEIEKKESFKEIFDYLNENYLVTPYKNACMDDYYYDTQNHDLAKAGISYRVRYRPQVSINAKLRPILSESIWSRYEYSCKVDGKTPNKSNLFDIDCDIHNKIKSFLGKEDLKDLENVTVVNQFRTGFILYFPRKNPFEGNDFMGVAFFDQYSKKGMNKVYYGFELESFQQSDVFASPYIFEEFKKVGNYIESLGHRISDESKKERLTLV